MKRREFIVLIGGAALWPPVGYAQQAGLVRRIAVLFPREADDLEAKARFAALQEALLKLGWTEGRNVRIEARWSGLDAGEIRRHAADLVAGGPDVIVATGSPTLQPPFEATRTVPIVFVTVGDPVGSGFVDSLAEPGGNATGFALFEYGLAAKWVELLKQIAPNVVRAAVIRDPEAPAGIGQFAIIQAAATAVGVEVTAVNGRDAWSIERAVTAFSGRPNGGLIVTASAVSATQRDLIVTLSTRQQLPTVYWQRFFATGGGLISYGPDLLDMYRRAAGYIDQILKGAKPADLPVQVPTKYELVVNLKTAKGLGLTVPPSLLARADEIIE
jgi:putative ABC transport system substrate-binding protein